MNDYVEHHKLIADAANKNGIAPELLEQLLNLEAEFTNFTLYGAKTDFSRRVAKILDEAAAKGAA
jgi:hypothetical protein